MVSLFLFITCPIMRERNLMNQTIQKIKKTYKDNEVQILTAALMGAFFGAFIGGALLARKVAGDRYPMSADFWATDNGREALIILLRDGSEVVLEKKN